MFLFTDIFQFFLRKKKELKYIGKQKYFWMSIFSAKIVVKQGARQWIGSGGNILILGTPQPKDGLFFSPNI